MKYAIIDDRGETMQAIRSIISGLILLSMCVSGSAYAQITNVTEDDTYSDIAALPDFTGDGLPDVGTIEFVEAAFGPPHNIGLPVYSGQPGYDSKSIVVLGTPGRRPFGVATVSDANQDGVADDAAISLLLVKYNGAMSTTTWTRPPSELGEFVSNFRFLNLNWRPIDIVGIDDLNGDGVTDDTAIGVLAARISDGQAMLQLRDAVSGALISNVFYLDADWTPVAAAVVNRSAMAPAGTLRPLIGVIAERMSDGRRVLQSRVAGTGEFDQNIKVLNSNWLYRDASVNHDANGDGVDDDPIWQVLAMRMSDNTNRVQSRWVSDGSFHSNTRILNENWEAIRLDTSDDIDGNQSGELIISAVRRSDGTKRIHIKDFSSATTTRNINQTESPYD